MLFRYIKNALCSFLFSLGLLSFGVSATPTICGIEKEVTLFAGQTIDAGTVTISNDENNLYVTFTTTNGWQLKTTHLHVSSNFEDIPTTPSGNPKVGKFEYQTEHDPFVTTYTYTVPESFNEGDTVFIAAHAEVVQTDCYGEIIESETGWGDGTPFDGRSWATYIKYQWQACEPTVGSGQETAFAYDPSYSTSSVCFLDIKSDGSIDVGNGDFNRWGWTSGPLSPGYSNTFNIYAGAGQCDLSKGTLVGTLTVSYNYSEMVTVTYSINSLYSMTEAQLYVGNDILPQNSNGDFTVAPGQYNNQYTDSNGFTTHTFTVSNVTGDIYVVAHATVTGF